MSSGVRAASDYINNLLLARGLARDGKPIDFVRALTGGSGSGNGSDGSGAKKTSNDRIGLAGQVLNLVHNLILHHKGEQKRQDSAAQTIQSLQVEAGQKSSTIARLEAEKSSVERKAATAEQATETARAGQRAAESVARGLREEVQKQKSALAQTRSTCASELRKRDVQLQRLRTHLTSQQRGAAKAMTGSSITIVPGCSSAVSGSGLASGSGSGIRPADGRADASIPKDPAYSLRQETTDFLTQLSQELSDENDGLISVVRGTISTLQDLLGHRVPPDEGYKADPAGAGEPEAGKRTRTTKEWETMQLLPTSVKSLAAEMDGIVERVGAVLTDPNFVPVAEVSGRDEEIARLRDGWERMEGRWREAIAMMDRWKKRMGAGDTLPPHAPTTTTAAATHDSARENRVSRRAALAEVDFNLHSNRSPNQFPNQSNQSGHGHNPSGHGHGDDGGMKLQPAQPAQCADAAPAPQRRRSLRRPRPASPDDLSGERSAKVLAVDEDEAAVPAGEVVEVEEGTRKGRDRSSKEQSQGRPRRRRVKRSGNGAMAHTSLSPAELEQLILGDDGG